MGVILLAGTAVAAPHHPLSDIYPMDVPFDLDGQPIEDSTGTITAGDQLNMSGNEIVDFISDARSSAPQGASAGQMWYDTSQGVLKYYNGTNWIITASADSVSSNLQSVLSAGNDAGSFSINMTGQSLQQVDELQFQNANDDATRYRFREHGNDGRFRLTDNSSTDYLNVYPDGDMTVPTGNLRLSNDARFTSDFDSGDRYELYAAGTSGNEDFWLRFWDESVGSPVSLVNIQDASTAGRTISLENADTHITGGNLDVSGRVRWDGVNGSRIDIPDVSDRKTRVYGVSANEADDRTTPHDIELLRIGYDNDGGSSSGWNQMGDVHLKIRNNYYADGGYVEARISAGRYDDYDIEIVEATGDAKPEIWVEGPVDTGMDNGAGRNVKYWRVYMYLDDYMRYDVEVAHNGEWVQNWDRGAGEVMWVENFESNDDGRFIGRGRYISDSWSISASEGDMNDIMTFNDDGSVDYYPQDCTEVSSGSGTYTIDPDGAGGVKPFDVYCEMSENGGGWIKLSVGDVEDSSCNAASEADNAVYVDKRSSNSGEWSTTFDNYLDRDPDNFCLDQGNIDDQTSGLNNNQFYRKDIDYVRGTDQSAQYTEAQENALREQMTALSHTTEIWAHSYDDDHDKGGSCDDNNGEIRLYAGDGGQWWQPTYWQVDSGTQGWTVGYPRSRHRLPDGRDNGQIGQHNNLPDTQYKMPAEVSGYNGCSGSGGSTSIAFGYEKSYLLIK